MKLMRKTILYISTFLTFAILIATLWGAAIYTLDHYDFFTNFPKYAARFINGVLFWGILLFLFFLMFDIVLSFFDKDKEPIMRDTDSKYTNILDQPIE